MSVLRGSAGYQLIDNDDEDGGDGGGFHTNKHGRRLSIVCRLTRKRRTAVANGGRKPRRRYQERISSRHSIVTAVITFQFVTCVLRRSSHTFLVCDTRIRQSLRHRTPTRTPRRTHGDWRQRIFEATYFVHYLSTRDGFTILFFLGVS